MRTTSRLAVLGSLVFFLVGAVAAAADIAETSAAVALDVSGTWNLTVLDTGRTFTPSFVLKQSGEQLSGIYKNSQGDNPASGTIKGDAVTLNAEITGQDGQKRTVTYVGIVKGNTMTGKLQTTRADVTFTAQRQ
jgi:hypothetical protein